MRNEVQLEQMSGKPMPVLIRFRARIGWILRWLDRALKSVPPRHVPHIERLQQGFQTILTGLDSGRYGEPHLPRLTARAVEAVNTATVAIWQRHVPPGMIPAQLEYAPGSRVLLVGERPGPMEWRTGIPFCDTLALQSSRCFSCRHAEPCYAPILGSTSGQSARSTISCRYEPSQDEPILQRLVDRSNWQNTGNLLRDLLLESGMYRLVWPNQEYYEGLMPVSITNLYPATASGHEEEEQGGKEEWNGESGQPVGKRDLLGDAPLWLLAVHALLVDPRVTVLFGYRASMAVYQITDTKSGMFHTAQVRPSPPFGYTITTFHPVNLLREQDEWKREIMMHSIRNALLKAAAIANDERHWPFVGADDYFTIRLYQESLAYGRRA